MPDSKITALASTGTGTDPANDPLVIVDVSDTSMAATGTTKKVTLNQLLATSPTATLASATITGDLTVRTTGLTVNSSGVGVGITAALGAGNIQIGAGKYLGYSATAYITPEDNVQGARIKANQVLIDATDAKFNIAGSEAMRLNSTGLGVGVSPAHKLQAVGGYVASGKLASASSGDIGGLLMYCSTDNGGRRSWGLKAESGTTGVLGFWLSSANNTEPFSGTQVMSLDASANLLVGTTTNTDNFRTNIQFNGTATNGLIVKNLASTGGPLLLQLNDSAQTLNTAVPSAEYVDSTTQRWRLYKNGGLANYQANNVNLSDVRTKIDIKPLGSYWNKIKSLEVVTFKYNDQTHSDDNIGLIAQQVESVAPELVDVDGFGETPVDGVPLKTIYTTDLYHAAIKALQEAMTRIEALESKLA